MNYFKEKVTISPIGAEVPRWLWDLTIGSLWFAALMIFIAGIIVIISGIVPKP